MSRTPSIPIRPEAARAGEADKIVVGVADLQVARDPSKSIITYALGSCIGVTLYDPVAKVGGMLHFMLPESTVSAEKAAANPAMFGDLDRKSVV